MPTPTPEKSLLVFPKEFAWGISTSAYQTEESLLDHADHGFKTDWDLFFEAGFLKTPKAQGTQAFSQFERDLRGLKDLGVSHYRFNIEWARIEPKPGQFNEAAIEHYLSWAKRLRAEGITPILALWHFTFPSWLSNFKQKSKHGWLHPEAETHWERYVKKIVGRFKDVVDVFAPQNEPNTQSAAGFLLGAFPPGGKYRFRLFYRNMAAQVRAFQEAARLIREIKPEAKIISIQNLIYWQKSALDFTGLCYRICQDFNFFHLDRVSDCTDFIGFSYYMGALSSPLSLWSLSGFSGNSEVSDLGWPIMPAGLESILREVSRRYHKPVFIMENGIADHTDQKRGEYIRQHLSVILEAVQQGLDVRGYFLWTLVDNFEWTFGYGPKFGLFQLDSQGSQLIPKKSAAYLKAIIQASRSAAGN